MTEPDYTLLRPVAPLRTRDFTAQPVPPTFGRWRFWADMIVNDAPLGPVEVNAFGYTSRLNGFGSGTVTVTMPCGIPAERLLRLWSWRLWAFYDERLVWCGVPTGLIDDNVARSISLTLTEITGYLYKRVWDWHPKYEFRQVEQTEIAFWIAQKRPDDDTVRGCLGEVGVDVIREPGPNPVLRDRTYEFLEGDTRANLLMNLCNVQQGPEFRSEYRMGNDGLPHCTMRIAYPRVGTRETGLGVMIPGGALSYRLQWDVDKLRTWTWAVGDLPEDAISSSEPNPPKPCVLVQRNQPGDLPRLDMVDNWPSTYLLETLRERANSYADTYLAPALEMTAAPPTSYPPLGSYGVGDDVNVTITDQLLPNGLVLTGRLTEISVSAGSGSATWTIVTSMPPPVPRETITGRLDRFESTVSSVFKSGRLERPWDAESGEPSHPPDVTRGGDAT